MAQLLISQKLESLRRCVSRIETRIPESVEVLIQDLDAQDIISLNLTRAIQICVDIGAHWLAQHPDYASPQTMGETFELLATAGAIDNQLAINLRKAVGFRNIVVHNYDVVDWGIVFSLCTKHLENFKGFARQMLILPSG